MDPHSSSSKSNSRRRAAQSAQQQSPLTLSALPRFHPAAYTSNYSNMPTTPTSTAGPSSSSQPLLSPRSQQSRHRALYHTLLNQHPPTSGERPPSPKLVPLAGSPGAVTPLELEGENYLSAGSSGQDRLAVEALDAIMRQEAARRAELAAHRQTAVSGA